MFVREVRVGFMFVGMYIWVGFMFLGMYIWVGLMFVRVVYWSYVGEGRLDQRILFHDTVSV